MGDNADKELHRLRWHCRRGLLELDYIFEDYLDQRYAAAPEEERAQFRALLDNQDPDPLQLARLPGRSAPADRDVARLVRIKRAPAAA